MPSRSPTTTRPTLRAVHRHQWLWEPLESDPTFVLRPMFGTKAAYLGGRLMLCFSPRAEPWRGVLVCTDRPHHAALVAEFPALSPHPILPKWLYLPESAASFETDAARLVSLARSRDPRLGIEPGSRKKSKQPAARAISPPASASPRPRSSSSRRPRRGSHP